jgi:hypothetical protein
MTLAGAFEWYFKARARKRSREADRRISEHLLEEFGAATRLRDLTASRIAAYRERRLAAGSVRRKDETGKPARLSAASINRPLAVLRHLLRLAQEEWEVLPTVPKVRLEKEPQGRLRWLEPDEKRRLRGVPAPASRSRWRRRGSRVRSGSTTAVTTSRAGS